MCHTHDRYRWYIQTTIDTHSQSASPGRTCAFLLWCSCQSNTGDQTSAIDVALFIPGVAGFACVIADAAHDIVAKSRHLNESSRTADDSCVSFQRACHSLSSRDHDEASLDIVSIFLHIRGKLLHPTMMQRACLPAQMLSRRGNRSTALGLLDMGWKGYVSRRE